MLGPLNPVRPPRILVTRSPHQASALAGHLRALGAEPILIPTIEIVAPTSFAPLDAALRHLDRFHWLIFTSANAVEGFHRRLEVLEGTGSPGGSEALKGTGFSPSIPEPTQEWALAPEGHFPGVLRIAAIGSGTAKALTAIDLTPDLIPPQAIAESLAEALLPHALQPDATPTRFLLIRAEEAREYLPETLRVAGAEVTIAPAYRTVIPTGSIDAIRELFSRPENYPDAITFTSASTARNLFALLEAAGITFPSPHKSVILSEMEQRSGGVQPKEVFSPPNPESVILSEGSRICEPQPKDLLPSPHPIDRPYRSTNEPLQKPVIASIGPITSATLRDLGHSPDVEATESTVVSLATNIISYFNKICKNG
jgi:uroporphyrinogen-III synthase